MRKKGLGKGIEALIPTKDKETFYEGYRFVPTQDIVPNPHQPRTGIPPDDIKELAESIKEKGVIEPLIVKRSGKKFILAAGERRFRAAQAAGLKEVPVVIRELTDQELLEIGIIENLHRKDLNPIEEARAYNDLHKIFGMTHEKIAQLVGKDRSTVTNIMRVLNLPERIRKHLITGKLSSGHARVLLGIQDEATMTHLVERILRDELSVRATESLIQKFKKKPRISPGPHKEPNLLVLEEELSKLLHTKVTIDWKHNRGKITIHLKNLDDFTRIHGILKRGKKA